ncbi:hypothetical protein [Pedobacter sp. R-06]|uniref:hypothetical protein n=1 Tax=Pedobacter sp. R-06 TaxID=3404051 RepID=UPI003CF6EE67
MEEKIRLDNISTHYTFKIFKSFDNNPLSLKALEVITKSLKELYRFFEPAFFTGNFFLYKHFNDEFLYSKTTGELLYDRNILINKTAGDFAIQIFETGETYIWYNIDKTKIYEAENTLTYHFTSDQDSYIAKGSEIKVASEGKGSNYAPYFVNLSKALIAFKHERVFRSTCPTFRKSWNDPKYIAFAGEGSGNNAPEKYIQESLHEFLRTQESLRGIAFECSREHNFDSDKPKPVDVRMLWREANRHALIEIKYTGLVINKNSGKSRFHPDQATFDDGYFQVKGYYDSALKDHPTTIAKALLVVIDGRRSKVNKSTQTVNEVDGMFYKDVEVEISADKRYYQDNPAFEKPIRMFAAPITN